MAETRWRVDEGDCRELMAAMPEASVDAIVCDPPYGLEFMGREWDSFREDDPGTARNRGERAGEHGATGTRERWGDDGRSIPSNRTALGGGKRPSTSRCTGCGKRDQFRNAHDCAPGARWATELIDPHAAPPSMLAFQSWTREWAREALRVLKPGGHLLAFGGTRTYHRLTCGLEDAGFEVRDCLVWLYGTGFPKSLDVSKAIDRAAGAEREVLGQAHADRYVGEGNDGTRTAERSLLTAPASAEAQAWSGWGTALKPAHEPIVVARKPLAGTVAANVLEHGTGALNVEGCRIDFRGAADEQESKTKNRHADFGSGARENRVYGEDDRARGEHGNYDAPGRWPANVVLDEAAAAMLDAQAGELTTNPGTGRSSARASGYAMNGEAARVLSGGDSGGASRFLYVAKASSAERNAGLDGFEVTGRTLGHAVADHSPRANAHPTVKPIDLMRWFVRLVTPPEGVVLDPFAGSGTTGCAAMLEGLRFVGLERDGEYVKLARARIGWWASKPEGMDTDRILAADTAHRPADGQLGLL